MLLIYLNIIAYSIYVDITVDGEFRTPLEVKMTVLPDSTTFSRSEDEWGSEIVVRSATTSYCALGMFDRAKAKSEIIREIFEDTCSSIQAWDNNFEMSHKMADICSAVDNFEREFLANQKPLVMQPIWKTQGKSHFLSENAFDLVIWSDYAFSRLFIDHACLFKNSMSRQQRATARLARCLWELSKSRKIRLQDIYRQMAFGNQTDKEYSVSGKIWRKYITSERTITPILKKNEVTKIIDDEKMSFLSPERRFDQTLFIDRLLREAK